MPDPSHGGSIDVAFLIGNIGDYHAPRLAALDALLRAGGGRLSIFEQSSASSFYHHRQTRGGRIAAALNVTKAAQLRKSLASPLETLRFLFRAAPSHIVVLGYNDGLSWAGLVAAKLTGAKIYFLSDSKADDQDRSSWGEALKKFIVRRFDGALVAGERHKRYFVSLGLAEDHIDTGYDVVDNAFFARRAAAFRRKAPLVRRLRVLPERYILCVSRLVPRKRVDLAVRVFAASGLAKAGVKLLIVGNGPERERVEKAMADAGLSDEVVFRDEVKNTSMPLLYAFADAVILASEFDQWGLSINEAMACGTPALVTYRCGCAGEIVQHDENGYVWDGVAITEASVFLRRMSLDGELRARLNANAVKTMADWNLDRFAHRLVALMAAKA